MKKKFGLLLAGMLATSVIAQTGTTPPPLPAPGAPPTPEAPVSAPVPVPPAPLPPADTSVLPPATTNKPAAKPTKKTTKKTDKAAAKKAAADKKSKTSAKADTKKTEAKPAAPLALNQPAVAKQDHVNVRGQANINSEVVAHLKKGEAVTVLEEVTKKAKTDEPSQWAKIAMPAGTHVWVNSAFVENNAVKSTKLNVRSGAGENYSVVGLLHKGDAIKAIGTKGDWTEIEAPAGAYAFVAAHLLEPAPAGQPVQIAATTPPPAPAPVTPTPAPVESTPPIAPPTTEAPVAPPTVPAPTELPIVSAPNSAPLLPPVEQPPVKRTVDREGLVTGTVSIQAPSYYQLKSLDNGNVIDYLHSDSTSLVLKKYKGKKVLVSGEEGLDERWPNTPVLTIQKIQIVE
ncbi:MAG: type 3 domain protein [Pedosphaera sp.]|nr:type 3 domain protein [Pedosphaera sp.]